MRVDRERYGAIDGLRVYSAVGIAAMHVLIKGQYPLHGWVFESLIPSFANLVFLFMAISCFSMCCGYYESILAGTVSLETFYRKRYAKIWPFFAALCLLDIVIAPSCASFYEAFANMTLCFGLLPNAKIEVIGVGWTLGVIFLFYMLFPFFCFLFAKRSRAWLAFIVSVAFHFICNEYFFDSAHVGEGFSARANFIYCAMYFLAGGLIFLYRREISAFVDRYRFAAYAGCVLSIVLFFVRRDSLAILLAAAMMLICGLRDAVGGGTTKWFGHFPEPYKL